MNKISLALCLMAAIILCSGLGVRGARADESSDVIGEYTKAYSDYMNQVLKGDKKDRDAEEKNWKALNKAETKMRDQQRKDQNALDKQSANLRDLQTRETNMQTEITNLSAVNDGSNAKKIKSDKNKLDELKNVTIPIQQKAVTDAQTAVNSLATPIQNGQKALDQQVTTTNAKIATYSADANTTTPSAVRLNAAANTAQQFYTKATAQGTNSALMQAQLGTLQTEGKMDQTQTNALMKVFDTNLNGTEMNRSGGGVSMNDQIAKAVAATCTTDFQNACAVKNATDRATQIAKIMQGAFSANGITAASTSSTGQQPPASVTAPAGPSTGAAPAH